MNINIQKQKHYHLVHVVLLLMVVFLVGCSPLKVGRDFDMQAFESMVKIGKTTKVQVLNKIGSPKSTGISLNRDGERFLEWVYFYATGKLSGMDDAQLKILQIRFDRNGILSSYNWTNSDK